MPPEPSRYQPVGPLLVRASTDPGDLDPQPPDATTPRATTGDALAWLAAQWMRPDVREALSMASPHLATRVSHLLACSPGSASTAAVRRAVLATASYLLRWQRRTTPFGLFAAVTAATIGPAAARFGTGHRAVARVDGDWLTLLVDRLESDHDLRHRLLLVADSARVVRDGRVIVEPRPQPGQRSPGLPRESSTRHTPAVRLALTYAARPIRFDQLTARIAQEVPQVAPATIEAMVHGLINGGFLITNLRPPMTAVDGLTHVIDMLDTSGAAELGSVAPILGQLRRVQEQVVRHNTLTDPARAAQIRAAVSEPMTKLAAGSEHQLALDLRLDARISVPPPVLDEAARAVEVLLRLSTLPFGSLSWVDYHARFRDRYGPGTMVPVRDLVADSGLGYPTGFLGAPRARPSWRVLTERDVRLGALIQKALLDGADEIRLTDADIDALTVGEHPTAVPPRRVELGFALHAATTQAIDRGDFQLQVVAAPKTPTSMAGRFAYLLDPANQAQVAASFTNSDKTHDVLAVQLSFPPRRTHNQNVTRVGALLPEVLSLSEHPDRQVITVDDLAVTADAEQMYLVHQPTGRRVIPHIPHALDTIVQTPPLARFLAEVADARSAVFGPFDPGPAARNLPYLPRVRYGRTILAPARWLLTRADLTPDDPHHADTAGDRWAVSLKAWRRRWRVPARVVACHGELRLPLDLDQPLDRALLRRLTRADRLELREDTPVDGYGWSGGRPVEFLIPMALTVPPARPVPSTTPPGRTLRPGASTVVHARLVGNPACFDHVLTAHLPILASHLLNYGLCRWWIRRHRDMIRLEADQHLSLFLEFSSPDGYAAVCAMLAEFASGLAERGLPGELILAPYHQHPARYGRGTALHLAQEVFAADTAAAIAQLRTADQAGIPAQALAAASMARLAAAFAPDQPTGYRTLLSCLRDATQPAERILTDLARHLADPTSEHRHLHALPGGDAVTDAWQARDLALRAYRDHLLPQRDPASVLPTLLHEHHMRGVGLDPDIERSTNHAARAAAMRCLAQASAR